MQNGQTSWASMLTVEEFVLSASSSLLVMASVAHVFSLNSFVTHILGVLQGSGPASIAAGSFYSQAKGLTAREGNSGMPIQFSVKHGFCWAGS